MFSFLYETVFPALGRFFGTLSGFAQTSFIDVIAYVLPGDSEVISIACTNVFTGEVFARVSTNWVNFFSPIGGKIVGKVNEILRGCIYYFSRFLGVTNLPLWIALIVMLSSIFIAVLCVKFIKNLFPI